MLKRTFAGITIALLVITAQIQARDLAGIKWSEFKKRSDFVFSGVLQKAEMLPTETLGGMGEIEYTYKVYRVFKGEKLETVTFRVPAEENINKTVGHIAIVALKKSDGNWQLSVDERSCWKVSSEMKKDFGSVPVYAIPTILLYDFPKELGETLTLQRLYADGYKPEERFVYTMKKVDNELEKYLK